MMTKKEKQLLYRIKSNAFKLRDNGQIPYKLYLEILRLNFDSNIKDVEFYFYLSEKYTRVGGYYIRHPEFAYDCDKEIEDYQKR